uniref:WAP domain-containing protein n=1 Tax=Cyprinus carpio TaxID=7962 RepID=A0A8C2HF66_CYPCA
MHSEDQEEHKSVKMEFIEDYSEIKSDPDPFRVKHEDTEKPTGSKLEAQPNKAKTGVCPIFSLDGAVFIACLELCSHDLSCPNDEKCCSNGCGHQCMAPYKEKPGVCPKINLEDDMLGVCAELCSQDGHCPDDEKCCSNGCGHQCMAPSIVKPGVCPRNVLGKGLCKELCVDDIECPNDEKCCSTKCGHECTPPFKVRPGLCLKPNVC